MGIKIPWYYFKEQMYEASFFTRWVVGAWNSLPGEVVEADTVVTFKGRLDKYMKRMGIGIGTSC